MVESVEREVAESIPSVRVPKNDSPLPGLTVLRPNRPNPDDTLRIAGTATSKKKRSQHRSRSDGSCCSANRCSFSSRLKEERESGLLRRVYTNFQDRVSFAGPDGSISSMRERLRRSLHSYGGFESRTPRSTEIWRAHVGTLSEGLRQNNRILVYAFMH